MDTTPTNGCIGVIPYSQRLSHTIRGPQIKQSQYPCNETLIANMGRLLPLKAGQMLVYDHRMQHYSTANDSDRLRPAINISLVPQGVEIIHYTRPEGSDKIHRYVVKDPDFFIRYDNFQIRIGYARRLFGPGLDALAQRTFRGIHQAVETLLLENAESFP